MTEFLQLLDAASKITIISVLVLIIWGGIKKLWVHGWLYLQIIADYEKQLAEERARTQTMQQDRDEWKKLGLNLLMTQREMAGSLGKLAQAQTQLPAADTGAGSGSGSG
jgi:hypothetical protein